MDAKTKTTILRRLTSAAGHIKGVERMVADDAYCIDVIQQIQAVQAALHKVNAMLLDAYLHTCVSEALSSEDLAERERMLQEVSTIFSIADKVEKERLLHS